jgi:hypothetical protein
MKLKEVFDNVAHQQVAEKQTQPISLSSVRPLQLRQRKRDPADLFQVVETALWSDSARPRINAPPPIAKATNALVHSFPSFAARTTLGK